MKSVISLTIILLLFQTLMLGSLVKLELPEVYTDKWEETRIDKQVVLDPFLIPGKDGLNQNVQNRNEWVPFHYNKVFIGKSTSAFPIAGKFLLTPGLRNNYKVILAYILNGTLRI